MSLKPVSNVTQKVVSTEADLIQSLGSIVSDLAKGAINERGCFTIGLSGGSMAKFVCECFPSIQTDWKKWKLYFCDERLVPIENEHSTLRLYIGGLIGNTGLTKEQFVAVETTMDVQSAAEDYQSKIKEHFNDVEWPSFDLLLLGMGPDGHTASLFPGHPLLEESKLWIAPISDSPKPPKERVTMTFPVINRAKTCIFAACGQSKADMIKVWRPWKH